MEYGQKIHRCVNLFVIILHLCDDVVFIIKNNDKPSPELINARPWPKALMPMSGPLGYISERGPNSCPPNFGLWVSLKLAFLLEKSVEDVVSSAAFIGTCSIGLNLGTKSFIL